MVRARKLPDLPLADRPRWYATDPHSELFYLGWGLRSYGRYPTTPLSGEGWSYSVILKGTPTILLGEESLRLAPNQTILVAPRRRRFGFRDEHDAIADILIWVWRTPPLVPQIRPPTGGHLLFELDTASRQRLEAVHAACRREVTNADPFTAEMLRGLRVQLDTELVRRLLGHGGKPDRGLLVEIAVRWMQEHLQCANPVFLLCDYLQIARSTLDELFHDAFGESPSTYHRRLRMEKARELLDSGQSVKAVAFALGYKHANDFSRAFRGFRTDKERGR